MCTRAPIGTSSNEGMPLRVMLLEGLAAYWEGDDRERSG